MFFLYLKWYGLWAMAAEDLRLYQLGGMLPFGPRSFRLEVEDQGGSSMDLYLAQNQAQNLAQVMFGVLRQV